MRYLTFALAKGRLAEKTIELLESVGIKCHGIKEKSRKLVFTDEEYKLRFILVKAADVPTYVEYGTADIGVVGKDTLLEERRNLYEVLNLGFGKCHMVVAGSTEMKDKLNNGQDLKVGTKYPNIASNYFFNKKRQTVEIIKLSGSVELAPIVGLSEVIVDIVETGSTLRENGLVILENICPITARMVVNRVSMKMEYDRITELIERVKNNKPMEVDYDTHY